MKKFSFLLLLLALFGTGFSFAQTGDTDGEESMADIPQGHILSIFSQDGAPFWLVLNGVKQSDKPSARVKVVGLKLAFYRARVVFQDEKKPAIDTRIQLEGAEPGYNHLVYVIRPSKKKKDNGQLVIAMDYFESINKAATTATSNVASGGQSTQDDQFPTFGYTTTKPVPMDEVAIDMVKKSMDMTMDIVKMGMEMEKNNPNTTITTSGTTTSTTTRSGGNTGGGAKKKPVTAPNDGEEANADGVQAAPRKGSSGNARPCINPMYQNQFNDALKNIKNESFASDKVGAAKDLADSECLSAAQIASMVEAMSYEADKLEIAKYAYTKCTNKNEYLRTVNLKFGYSASKEELREFIKNGQ